MSKHPRFRIGGNVDPSHHMTLNDFEAARMLSERQHAEIVNRDGVIHTMAADMVLLENLRDRAVSLYNWLQEHWEQLPAAHQNAAREQIHQFREGLEQLNRREGIDKSRIFSVRGH